VVLQPGYMPWVGFFDQMKRCDVFVYYDDVQYDRNGWRNRNRIKSASGPIWLTVPVRSKSRHKQLILDVDIDYQTSWPRKHLTSIYLNYNKSRYFKDYYHIIQDVLQQDWLKLVDLDIAVIEMIAGWLGITRKTVRSSQLKIGGNKNSRLIEICRYFKAVSYLSGNSALDYLDLKLFEEAGIAVEWQNFRHPVYPQAYGGFIPYFSAIDLILNVGCDAGNYLMKKS